MADLSDRDRWMAEARGAAYALAAATLRYPRSIPLRAMAEPQFWERTLSPVTSGDDALGQVCAELRSMIDDLGRRDSIAEAQGELEDEYSALFGHAVRGACPPYELEYGAGDIVQRAPDLADIAGFYAAFGLEMAADSDRPDHLTAESEFMSMLCRKEAAAHDAGEADHVQQCREAQRAFLRDHLSGWWPTFAHRVSERAEAGGFYARTAAFVTAFVSSECRRWNLVPGPVLQQLRPADPDRDSSIECGPETGVPGDGEHERLVQLNVPSV